MTLFITIIMFLTSIFFIILVQDISSELFLKLCQTSNKGANTHEGVSLEKSKLSTIQDGCHDFHFDKHVIVTPYMPYNRNNVNDESCCVRGEHQKVHMHHMLHCI